MKRLLSILLLFSLTSCNCLKMSNNDMESSNSYNETSNDNLFLLPEIQYLEHGENWVSLMDKDVLDSPLTQFDDIREPGYTMIFSFRLISRGNIACFYELYVSFRREEFGPNGESLKDVIDVYTYSYDVTNSYEIPQINSFKEVTESASNNLDNNKINEWYKIGTLTDWISSDGGVSNGKLLPNGIKYPNGDLNENVYCSGHTMTIVLHMQETAGPEYQGLRLNELSFSMIGSSE